MVSRTRFVPLRFDKGIMLAESDDEDEEEDEDEEDEDEEGADIGNAPANTSII